jgi:hypothetical protein
LKKEKKLAKKADELAAYAQGKKYDKRDKVHANRKSLQLDMQAQHEKLNLAMDRINEKVQRVEKNRKMFQMKHREVETLKFKDQSENSVAIKIAKFKADVKRDQKAIALTLMNNERREYMTSANDKLRNR